MSKLSGLTGCPDFDSLLVEIRGGKLDVFKATDQQKRTVLHLAAESNQLEFIYFVLARYSKQVDVNAEDGVGWTPLLAAAKAGALAVCNILLEKGAKATVRAVDGSTVLHYLVRTKVGSGDETLAKEVLEKLLAGGADVDAASQSGETPLHAAALSGNPFFEKLLLAKGATLEAKSGNGQRPLHLAAASGSVDAVVALLDAGAEREPVASTGMTPGKLAAALMAADVVAAIENFRSLESMKPTERVWYALEQGRDELIPKLLEDRDVDLASEGWTVGDRRSLLQALCERARLEEVEAAAGLPTYMRCSKLVVVKSLAALAGAREAMERGGVGEYLSIFETLLDRGNVDPNLPSGSGEDSLMFAAVRAGNLPLVSLLLSTRRWGAEPNRKKKPSGETPLWVAASIGAPGIMALLLEFGADIEVVVDGRLLQNAARGACAEVLEQHTAMLQRCVPQVARSKASLELDLSGMALKSVPHFVYDLTYLRRLNLANNRLLRLEPEIKRLHNLRSLVLDDNNLSELPTEVGSMANLSHLSVKLNPCLNMHVRRLSEISSLRVKEYLRMCAAGVASQGDVSPEASDDESSFSDALERLHRDDDGVAVANDIKRLLVVLRQRETKLLDLNTSLAVERQVLDSEWAKIRKLGGHVPIEPIPDTPKASKKGSKMEKRGEKLSSNVASQESSPESSPRTVIKKSKRVTATTKLSKTTQEEE